MPKFSANLSFLHANVPFLDRFAAAGADGFPAAENVGPYDHLPEAVAEALSHNGLEQALLNLPVGGWAGGECGVACLSDCIEEFRVGVDVVLRYS
jgi:hydroxypyruvate isomerase